MTHHLDIFMSGNNLGLNRLIKQILSKCRIFLKSRIAERLCFSSTTNNAMMGSAVLTVTWGIIALFKPLFNKKKTYQPIPIFTDISAFTIYRSTTNSELF